MDPCRWLAGRDHQWLDQVRYAVLDLSGPWRLAFTTMLSDAVQACRAPNRLWPGPLGRPLTVTGGGHNQAQQVRSGPVLDGILGAVLSEKARHVRRVR